LICADNLHFRKQFERFSSAISSSVILGSCAAYSKYASASLVEFLDLAENLSL